jgi:hypothetical protein
MLYDNAPLLTNYLHTYQATRDEFFRDVVLDLLRFTETVLSDRVQGGFYSSQDADISSADDGSFFTWTLESVKNLLDNDEFDLIQRHFGLSTTGQMHTDPKQNVLHIVEDAENIASTLGRPTSEIDAIITSAKAKMLRSRSDRKAPFVDKSIYANWNGMMISAYLEAFKVIGREDCLNFALKTLDRILTEHLKGDDILTHRAASIAQEGFLDDQIEIANALLHAFEITSEERYLEKAVSLMRRTIELFGDHNLGGFFDIPVSNVGKGLLSIGIKPLQDSPIAGANSVAISVLQRLWILTNHEEFRTFAEKSLKYFSGVASQLGLFASRYFLALDEYLFPPPHIAIVCERNNEMGNDLIEAAWSAYRPGKTVAVYNPSSTSSLPDVLRNAGTLHTHPVAFVCSQFSCAPPAYDCNTLISTIQSFGRDKSSPRTS